MPMLRMKEKEDRVRWLQFLPFPSVEEARSYVANSAVPLHIVRLNDRRIGVVYPWDIEWIKELGVEEIRAETAP